MSKKDGIRISEKHGVNPTLGVCAWCGEETGEIAMLGYLPGDVEAPKHTVLSYAPCEECKKKWEQGVAIIEVSRRPRHENQPEIVEGAYPTGRLAVIDEKALSEGFKNGMKAFMWEDEFEESFGEVMRK